MNDPRENVQERLNGYADKWMKNPQVRQILHSRDDMVKIAYQEFNTSFGIWSSGVIQVRQDEVSAVLERMRDNTSRYKHVRVMEKQRVQSA